MTVSLRTSLNTGLNSGLRQSISGGAGARPFTGSTLDLDFAGAKTLKNQIGKKDLVTFTRASSATFVDGDGLIKTTPVNLVTYSEQFNNAAWVKSNGSVSANVDTSPIGDRTADKWVPDTRNDFHFIRTPATTGSLEYYTYSVYAKQSGYRYILINTAVGSTSGNAGPIVDLQDGVVVDNFTATYPVTITDAGNGWWRIALTFNGNGGSISVDHNPLPTVAVASYIGDGTSGTLLWGAQLQKGSTATAYIPTTSTILGAPRFDHDPATGESLGLLIEEARTNLVSYSNMGSGFTFSGVSNTFIANEINPEGTAGYRKIRATADNAPHHLNALASTTNNLTVSVFVKFDTRRS